MDAAALLDTLTWQLLVVGLVAFVLGAAGGAIHERTAPPDPAATPPPVVTPAWRRALVGGVAAVAVLYLTNPETGVQLAGGSIVAGYAGQTILAALEARAVAALAQADARIKGEDVREALAATNTLINGPRSGGTPADDAAAQRAADTLARLNQKYARKG